MTAITWTGIRRLAVVSMVWALPALASAQSGTTGAIAGNAKDTTGAVLPGVTVEASSPALIEKVRAVVTDAQGNYKIVDLRPGTYSVTFTLPGFAVYRREGIELSTGFTATANGELKVGALQETVTVTGASPVVDVQNVRTQQVLKATVLEALPSGQRDLTQFVSLTLGATASTAGRNDVGGALAEANTGLSIHGGRGDDGKVNYDGMNTNIFSGAAGGQIRIWKFNMIGVQETVVDTGGSSAETETGGANINMVPRDGGNAFSVHTVLTHTSSGLAAGTVPASLVARGSAAQSNSMKQVWDYGVGIGGPIVRDRLWFYNANRAWGSQTYGANNYFNKSTTWYRYEADLSRPAYTDWWQRNVGGRLAWQASAKHKITASTEWERGCACWHQIASGTRVAPEASLTDRYGLGQPLGGMWLPQVTWSYPATNRLLFQAAGSFVFQHLSRTNPKLPGPDDVSILEQTTGYIWGAVPFSSFQDYSKGAAANANNFTQRASAAYITGSHAMKIGLQTQQGNHDSSGNALPNSVNYVFRNGLPLSISEFADPVANQIRVRSVALFAQDQWTINHLTLNLGLRYDDFSAYAKAITLAAGRFVPQRSYPEVQDMPHFQDVSPRIGASYDLFGNGKTAIKGSWGKYLAALGGGDANSLAPASAIFTSTSRLWTDGNGNFIPDCELTNPLANGECGTVSNLAFGQVSPVTVWAPSARTGWGVREFSYQYSLSLQHELAPGFGLTVAYNRNDWKNKQATVNQALTPADYTPYCITAPTDSRLGATSGKQVCGLYDQVPAKFGQVSAVRMRVADVAGRNGDPKEIFNGVDVAMNARFGKNGIVQGGVTLGRTLFDFCWQNTLPNVSQSGTPANLPRVDGFCRIETPLWNGIGSQIKLQAVYPLPYDLIVSGSFKNLPGIPITANYIVSNAQAAASLGRDLAACRGAVPCTATATAALLPSANISGDASATTFDARLNQVDLRLTRMVRLGRGRVQVIAELYNVLNARPAQGIANTYGPQWQLPTAILGGRLFKYGAQIDF